LWGSARVSEHDARQARLTAREVEEAAQRRAAKIEIDERDVPPGPGHGDSEVGDRGRLALALERARDHDRAGAALQIHELDVRAEHAKRFGIRPQRVSEHREPVVRAELARRHRDAREQRETQPVAHLACREHTRVQRLAEEGEPEPEHEPQHDSEERVARRVRLDLEGAFGRSQQRRIGSLQRLHRP